MWIRGEQAQSEPANNDPLVTVIVPFFNAEKFIQEAIESVLAQTYNNWELLLVDDGSTDGSSDIAIRYAQKDSKRVRYLQHDGHKNQGLSASRNLGVRHAKGEYVAFLDADDVWLPDKLQEQVVILDSNRDAAMVYEPAEMWYSWASTEDFRQDLVQQLGVPLNRLHSPPSLLKVFLKGKSDPPCISTILVRREAIERVGGFEEAFRGMYEDQVFSAKICLSSYVFVDSVIRCRYRKHEKSMVFSAMKTGEHAHARLEFLNWLAGYVSERGAKDKEILNAIYTQQRLWRLLSVHPILERTFDRISQLAILIGWLRSHLRTALIRTRIRSTMGLPPVGYSSRPNAALTIRQYYLERFLDSNSSDLRGNCLTLSDPYSSQARQGEPTGWDAGKSVTLGRVTELRGYRSNHFDCVICAHLLQTVQNPDETISELYRILRPEGALLLAVPGISMQDLESCDFWRFSPFGLRVLLVRTFGKGNVVARGYGNSLVAAGEMRGLVASGFTQSELDAYDPRFPVEACARAVKRTITQSRTAFAGRELKDPLTSMN